MYIFIYLAALADNKAVWRARRRAAHADATDLALARRAEELRNSLSEQIQTWRPVAGEHDIKAEW